MVGRGKAGEGWVGAATAGTGWGGPAATAKAGSAASSSPAAGRGRKEGRKEEGFINVVIDNRQPSQPTNCAGSTSAFAL